MSPLETFWSSVTCAGTACTGSSSENQPRSELVKRPRPVSLSVGAERDLLLSENRALKDEVRKQRRQYRKELAVQRAEAAAMQAERVELQQLAAEAKRLVDLKERIYSPSLAPPSSSSSPPSPPAGPSSPSSCGGRGGFASEEARLHAEAVLAHKHAAVLRRMQSLQASPKAKVLLNLPCVLRNDAKLLARMEKVRCARRPSQGGSSVGAGSRPSLSRASCRDT